MKAETDKMQMINIDKLSTPWSEAITAVPKHEAIRSNGANYAKWQALRMRLWP